MVKNRIIKTVKRRRSIYLDDSLWERVRRISQSSGRTISEWVKALLWHGLGR